MKNKNIVIAVIVIILLLIGAAGFLLLGKHTNNASKMASNETNKPSAMQQSTKSLLDLVKMGQNLRCTFKTEVANGSTDGTVYVSGQNVRADFNITREGKTQQTSMIKIGDTSYIWGSVLPMGIKMTLSFDQLSQNSQASQYVNPDQKLNYDCSPWNVDNSLFTVPTNVKFTDMTSLIAPKTTGGEMMPKTQTQTGTPADPCAQLTDPTTKAACESALKQAGR